MTATDSRRTSRRRSRPPFYRRWWFWLIVVIALLVGAAAWLGVRGLEAKSELEAALPLASQIQEQVLAGDSAGAEATVAAMAGHTEVARANTGDVVWRAAEFIPVAGANLAALRQLSESSDSLVNDALSPLAEIAPLLTPDAIKPVDGAFDLATLASIQPPVAAAASAVSDSLADVKSIDPAFLLPPLSAAVDRLDRVMSEYEPLLTSTSGILSVLPDALGASGPRDYLLAFQNNAEVMPRGGTVGSLVLVHVEDGRISLAQQASPLDFGLGTEFVIPIEPDAQQLWLGLGKNMQNLTETPRFSLSFDIAREMWQKKFGVEIDGLIALDPIVLSYITSATGPITLPDGGTLTRENLVKSLLSDVYVKYSNPLAQDAYYQAISATTFEAVASGNFDPASLLVAITKGAEEKRVLIWTSDPEEQALLDGSTFQGEPIAGTATTEGMGIYFRDLTPSKMAYYLDQSVTVSQASCADDGTRTTRVTVTLTNSIAPEAVKALPSYVSVARGPISKGDILIGVSAYAPAGYTLAASQSGSESEVTPGTDGDFVVAQTRDLLSPGETITSTFDFVAEGAGLKTMSTDISPVVNPTTVAIETVDCSAL